MNSGDRQAPSDPAASRPADRSVARPLTAVLFDLFYTLVDMRHVPPENSTPAILGIDPALWSRVVMEQSPHHALGTERDPVESLRRIAHAIDPGISLERIRRAATHRPARFRAALTQVRPEVIAGLEQLRGMRLKTGLVSNAGLDEIASWDESPLAPLFDAALFSCHEGVMKPDAEIYRRAAARLGTRPAECLYVGDGGSREHEGANAAGMHTVLFLGLLQATYPEIAAQRPRVTRWVVEGFPELLAVVRELRAHGLPPEP